MQIYRPHKKLPPISNMSTGKLRSMRKLPRVNFLPCFSEERLNLNYQSQMKVINEISLFFLHMYVSIALEKHFRLIYIFQSSSSKTIIERKMLIKNKL